MNVKSNTKAIISLLLIASLIFIGTSSVTDEVRANPDWLEGWQYRKSHVIEQTAGAGTNYQVKIRTEYETAVATYNLGYTTIATYGSFLLENQISGSVFITSQAGTVNFIRAYISIIGEVTSFKVKCAIYKHSDSSLVENSVTDEVTIPYGDQWVTFPYSGTKSQVEADTEYVLVAWSENIVGTICYLRRDIGDTNQGHEDIETYNSFPSTATFSHVDRVGSIYAEIEIDTPGSDEGETVYLNEHSQTDFDDVRFTASDGVTLLDYSLESKIDGDTATFWVKISGNLTESDQTIYVYYGNPDATSASIDFREDFTTYTEVDVAADRIQFSANHIDFDGYRGVSTYLYKDKGLGHFTNFEHKFDIYLVNAGSGGWRMMLCYGLTNTIGSWNAWIQYISVAFYFFPGKTDPQRIYLESTKFAGSYYACSHSTWYYCTLTKSGTSVTLKIYSDSARTKLLATLSGIMSEDVLFQYIYGCASWNDNYPTIWGRVDIENFLLRCAVDPEPQHGAWGSEETPPSEKEWRSIETWSFLLITRNWNFADVWNFNLITRQWLNIDLWSFGLLTRQWYNVHDYSFSLITKMWQNIESWNFNILTKAWQLIEYWNLNLKTIGWHIIGLWNFTLLGEGTFLIFIIFLACVIGVVFFMIFRKEIFD